MEWTLDDTVDDHAIRKIGVLVCTEILCGVKSALGAVNGDRERANFQLLDVLIFEVADLSG